MRKDPAAKLDFAVDWTDWLQAGETISDSTWTLPTGLAEATPAPSVAAGVATIWIEGGTAGERYDVTNHIVTSAGREDERTLQISVANR